MDRHYSIFITHQILLSSPVSLTASPTCRVLKMAERGAGSTRKYSVNDVFPESF